MGPSADSRRASRRAALVSTSRCSRIPTRCRGAALPAASSRQRECGRGRLGPAMKTIGNSSPFAEWASSMNTRARPALFVGRPATTDPSRRARPGSRASYSRAAETSSARLIRASASAALLAPGREYPTIERLPNGIDTGSARAISVSTIIRSEHRQRRSRAARSARSLIAPDLHPQRIRGRDRLEPGASSGGRSAGGPSESSPSITRFPTPRAGTLITRRTRRRRKD